MKVDKVTGKIVSETGWNVSSHTFGNVDTPVVAGYHADKSVAGGATITPDDLNKTIVITYAPNGHIIPVGPDGKPIPDAPQPQFPTNPDNPSETTPGQVPDVPGYHPESGKPGEPVNPVPGKPGEDVPVKYVPDTPVKPSTPFTPTTPETPRNNPTHPSETPIANNNIVSSSTPAPKADENYNVANNVESNKKKEELPQTGRKENQAQLIGLAVAGISFLLGLIGDRKKKE